MEDRSQRRTADAEGQHALGMAVHDAMDLLVLLVDLAVDKSLGIAFRRFFVDWLGIFDSVLFDVCAA